jgi:urease
VRFEPGERKLVWLCGIAGNAVVRGGNNLVDGPATPERIPSVMSKLLAQKFSHEAETGAPTATTAADGPAAFHMERAAYAAMFGPTVGDKVPCDPPHILCRQYGYLFERRNGGAVLG